MSDAATEAGVVRHAGTIAVLTAGSRIAGFVRLLVFSATVGASVTGSTYQSANTVPNVLFEIAAGGILAAATVPLLAGRVASGDDAGARAVASALLTWVVVILTPVALLLLLLRDPIAAALLGRHGLGPAATARGALMLAIFAPQIVLYGVGIVLTGILNAHNRFAAAAAAPLVSSLVVIATYVAYGVLTPDVHAPTRGAVLVLAIGTTLGVLALVLTVLLPGVRAGLRWTPTLRFPAGAARRALRLAGAGLIALLGQQVAVVAVIWLCNHRAGAGAVNVYQYAQALYLLPYAVLAVPLATAAFPVLAAAGTGAERVLARTARAVLVVGLLGAVALVVAAPDLGTFWRALDRGSPEAVAVLPAAVTALSPGLVGFGLLALFTRAVYARGAAGWGGAVAAVGWLVAGLLPLALTATTGGLRRSLVVIGLSSSIGMTLAALALAGLVRRAWGSASLAGLGRVAVLGVFAALVGVGLGRWLLPALWPAPGSGAAAALAHGVLAGAVGVGAATGLMAGSMPAVRRELTVRGPRR